MKTNKLWERSYPEHLHNYTVNSAVQQQNLNELATQAAKTYTDATAFTLVLPGVPLMNLSFKEIDQLSSNLCMYFLEDLGLTCGDVVAIQLPNSLQYPIAVFAAWKAGLIVTNVNPLYTPTELGYQLQDSGARLLIGIDLFIDNIKSVAEKLDIPVMLASFQDFMPPAATADDKTEPLTQGGCFFKKALEKGAEYPFRSVEKHSVALYQYTGGTTGRSKGAILTHANLSSVLTMTQDFLGAYDAEIPPGEVLLTALPLYHIFAFAFNFLLFFKRGASNLLIPSPRPLSNLKPAFENFDIDWMTGVDTLYTGLLEESWFQEAAPKLKFAVSGGTALRPTTAQRWRDQVSFILEGYGMTETSCFVSAMPPMGGGPAGSVGLPLPGSDVRIVDADGQTLAPGETGELAVRGPHIIKEYLNQPAETESAIVDGWLLTGDVVVMDEKGFITIVDRKKDMILISGFNVYPNEIEDVITQCPGVVEVAVIGVADDATGEAARAYVIGKDADLTTGDIQAYCRTRLTAYKVPKQIIFRDELPKSAVGKILRAKLKAENN